MILAIVGPTGVGKTKLSIELAKIYNGEIINCDSMQIYEVLDVGTAKITKSEMQKIPHHLLSVKKVDEDYTAFDYQKDARQKIAEIKAKNKVPIFVGGTGYYLKSALYDYNFSEENEPINKEYENLTNQELVEKISKYPIDYVYDKNNHKRLVRLLTRLENGYIPTNKDFNLLYDDCIFIGLTTNRSVLYERINKRFIDMLIPLIDEVKPYCLNNIKSKALQTGIGYKEFYPFFSNEKTLKETVEECQKNSRNYAKKQYTWFENQMDINWFNVNFDDFSKTISEVSNFIDSQNKN